MHRLKLIVVISCAATALALAACGGRHLVPQAVQPTPSPTPVSFHPPPSPSPTPFKGIADASSGLQGGAAPFAISAGGSNVWITDRAAQKAVGEISIPRGNSSQPVFQTKEFPTLGNHDPVEIAPDEIEGLVYTESGGSSFGRYDPVNQKMTEYPLSRASAIPAQLTQRGITANIRGVVYVALGSSNSAVPQQGVYMYDLVSNTNSVIQTSYDPVLVAVDHNQDLWVAEGGPHQIQVFDASGKLLKTLTLSANPTGLVEGPDWFMYALDSSGSVEKFDESTYAFTGITMGGCKPSRLAAGVNDDVWLSAPACNAIVRLSLADQSVTTVVNASHPGGNPDHISVDTAGHVWFTDSALRKVFEYNP